MKKLMIYVFIVASMNVLALRSEIVIDKELSERLSKEPLAQKIRYNFEKSFRQYEKSSEDFCFCPKEGLHDSKPPYCEYQRFMYSIIKQLLQLGYGIEDLWGSNGHLLLLSYFKLVMPNASEDEIKILCNKIFSGINIFLIQVIKQHATVCIIKDLLCAISEKMVILES